MHAGRYLPNTKSKHPPPVAITPTTLPPLLRQASTGEFSLVLSRPLPSTPSPRPPPQLLCLSYPLLETLFPSYLTATVGAWTFTDVITPTNVYKCTVMTHIVDVPRTWIFATSEAFSYGQDIKMKIKRQKYFSQRN